LIMATSLKKIELTADVVNCSVARGFVRESLARAPESLRNDALLLLSEVFTNALLHGRGPVTVEVEQCGDGYRIAVADCSSTPPTEKGYQADDATGRGLHLLDSLAAAWGWEPTDFGKVVWFDLPVRTRPPSPPSAHKAGNDNPYPLGTEVALLGAPVQAMIRTGAHYDAVYREFRLILELDPTRRHAVPGRVLGLIDELGTSFVGFGRYAEEAWETAVREGRETVDLRFRVPPGAAFFVEHYDELLDKADDYCRRAALLTVAPTDEALAVRRWAFGQVVQQCRGEAPALFFPVSTRQIGPRSKSSAGGRWRGLPKPFAPTVVGPVTDVSVLSGIRTIRSVGSPDGQVGGVETRPRLWVRWYSRIRRSERIPIR
jgi:anti-sigma regulatory factor (Ser/Thr protein kinase)